MIRCYEYIDIDYGDCRGLECVLDAGHKGSHRALIDDGDHTYTVTFELVARKAQLHTAVSRRPVPPEEDPSWSYVFGEGCHADAQDVESRMTDGITIRPLYWEREDGSQEMLGFRVAVAAGGRICSHLIPCPEHMVVDARYDIAWDFAERTRHEMREVDASFDEKHWAATYSILRQYVEHAREMSL